MMFRMEYSLIGFMKPGDLVFIIALGTTPLIAGVVVDEGGIAVITMEHLPAQFFSTTFLVLLQ